MNKKNKKSNFLRNLLATASIASVIVGGSSAAFGDDILTYGNLSALTGNWVNATGVARAARGGDSIFIVDGAHNLTLDAAIDLDTLNLYGHNGRMATATAAGRITNVISDPAMAARVEAANGVAGGPIPAGGDADARINFTIDGAIIRQFGNAATGAGVLTGLGNVTFTNAGAVMKINANGQTLNGDMIANGADDGIIQVNSNNLTFAGTIGAVNRIGKLDLLADKSATLNQHAVIKDILLGNGSTLTVGNGANLTGATIDAVNANNGTLIFNGASVVTTSIGNGNALKSIVIGNTVGGTVDFQGALVVALKATTFELGHAASVMKISTLPQTVTGDITTTGNNQGTLLLHGNFAHVVNGNVGASGHALANINFEGAAVGTIRTIRGEVFTKNINSNGGTIAFDHNVQVSNATNLTAITTINIAANKSATLGRVNFNSLNSTINVGDGGVLSGAFENPAAVTTGAIHFAGSGTFNGTANKLALIDITAPGILKFTGGTNMNVVTDIQATVANAHFEFADNYELTGNINGAALGITPNLDFKGNAKITGFIGNTNIVGNISIAKDKKLTVDSDSIRAIKIFDKADQGTLALTPKLHDVTITAQISELGGGTIDATGMAETKGLTIAGNIGTDPNATGSSALEKMLLRNSMLTLRPVAFANIAAIDFNKKTTEVNFATANVNYALGDLTNAGNVTLNIDRNISLYNTKTKDKLKEIKFTIDETLTLGKGNDITVAAITLPANKTGTLIFTGDSALRGPIGTANKKLKEIIVRGDTTVTTSGVAFVEGAVTLEGDKSVLTIDSNYTVGQFGGGASGTGILRFVNKDPVTLSTTYTKPAVLPMGPPIADPFAIGTLELTEGNVKLAALDGIDFKKIVFTSVAPAAVDPATAAVPTTAAAGVTAPTTASTTPAVVPTTAAAGVTAPTTAPTTPAVIATAPTLILDRSFSGQDVDSNFDSTTGKMPTIQLLSNLRNTIDETHYIGKDKDHLVNLQHTGDGMVMVGTQKFFATVTTTDNNKGEVGFGIKADKVYGLGSKDRNLASVHVASNIENFGDTYAKEVIVYGGNTYTAGGIISGGELRLGDNAASAVTSFMGNATAGVKANSVVGNATVYFKDGVTLLDNVSSIGSGNKIDFAGNAVIKGKIGESGNSFGDVTFSGNKDHTAILHQDMYVKDVNFGAENIKLAASKVIIGGFSHIDGNIGLDSNQLVLKDKGTWGTNTTINTILTKSGTLGSIVLNDEITLVGNTQVTVKIIDQASLKDHRDTSYVFISGHKYLVMENGDIKLPDGNVIGDVQTNQAYSKWKLVVKDGNLVLTRECDEVEGVKKDLIGIGDDIDQQNAKMLAEAQTGAAKEFMDDINLINDKQGGAAKRAEAIKRLTGTTEPQVAEEISNVVGHVSNHVTNIVGNRMFNIAGQTTAVGAGSDDGGAAMGAWAMPYYGQAVQKNKGDSVGYAVRSVGGVFGFDTLANDNLTIGAAFGIIKTNMKFKDYKIGGKSDVDTLMGVIYGSQQFDKDFFAQAVVSFASSKVTNSDPRIVPVHIDASGQQRAKASYNSMSYGGELLLGYNAKIDDSVLLTPMAGIRYTRLNDEGYKETGTKTQNKTISKKPTNRVEAIVGARIAATVDTSGVAVTPEAHAIISQRLSGKSGAVDARLDGMTTSFVTRSDKGAKTLYNVGVGVSAKAGTMEYGVGYDAYLANKYVGHQGTLKVRVNF